MKTISLRGSDPSSITQRGGDTDSQQILLTSQSARRAIKEQQAAALRNAILSRGEGTTSFWTGHFNPTSKSSVTFVDAPTMKQIGRAELGWDLGRAAFSPDGAALTVLTPGVTSNKPAEMKPAAI